MKKLTENDIENLKLIYTKYKEMNPKENIKFNEWLVKLAINGLIKEILL